MGKAIIVSDISFSTTDLGTVTFSDNISGNDFTITALENLTISFPNDLYYHNGKYRYWRHYEANTEISLDANDSISFKGSLIPKPFIGIGTFSVSGEFTVSGNILSLLSDQILVPYAFEYLFENCTGLTDASNLVLPFGTLESCYEGMFKGCSSLENAPILQGFELSKDCYKELFYGCSLLNNITILSDTPIGIDYTYNWVYGVSSNGTFNKTPYSAVSETGNHGIPNNWTIEESSYGIFTIESTENTNTIKISNTNCDILPTLEYSIDNGVTWNNVTIIKNTTQNIATINTGDKIIFKGINDRLSYDYTKYNRFTSNKTFKVYGNVMSLLYGNNFINNTEFITTGNINYHLTNLFSNTKLVEAHNLLLPAKTCTGGCYRDMFNGCSSLISTPKLPATTLAGSCYQGMFKNCSKLTTAPELLATTLTGASYCYQEMFAGTSLTTAPQLPATTLANNYCYYKMFASCKSLTVAPELPATTLANGCYSGMFEGCTSLTTAPELPATTLAGSCYEGMFNGCTSLTESPKLLATTLVANSCYYRMFQNCNKLNKVICLATVIPNTNCTGSWLQNVSSTGTFYKNSEMSSWSTGSNGIPSGWTVEDYVES